MSELYNSEYYHNYCGPIPYEDTATWVPHFDVIAERIVKDLKPQTVLDAGCAMGYLVAALRDRGVEAYGIDISEYAISKVREDVRPYCVVGSLTEPLPTALPRHYDLVVTIEVLEHLYEEEGKKAIRNLCSLSEHIVFSSTPDDFLERTHFNVQQQEYWARLFAEEGFYNDLNYRPTYVTQQAIYFKKSANWLRQVEDYERNLRILKLEQSRQLTANEALKQQLTQAQHDYEALKQQLAQAQHGYEALKQQLVQAQYDYSVISNAFFWKITKPARVMLDALKALLKRK